MEPKTYKYQIEIEIESTPDEVESILDDIRDALCGNLIAIVPYSTNPESEQCDSCWKSCWTEDMEYCQECEVPICGDCMVRFNGRCSECND